MKRLAHCHPHWFTIFHGRNIPSIHFEIVRYSPWRMSNWGWSWEEEREERKMMMWWKKALARPPQTRSVVCVCVYAGASLHSLGVLKQASEWNEYLLNLMFLFFPDDQQKKFIYEKNWNFRRNQRNGGRKVDIASKKGQNSISSWTSTRRRRDGVLHERRENGSEKMKRVTESIRSREFGCQIAYRIWEFQFSSVKCAMSNFFR